MSDRKVLWCCVSLLRILPVLSLIAAANVKCSSMPSFLPWQVELALSVKHLQSPNVVSST
jgi:hypothetical protein